MHVDPWNITSMRTRRAAARVGMLSVALLLLTACAVDATDVAEGAGSQVSEQVSEQAGEVAQATESVDPTPLDEQAEPSDDAADAPDFPSCEVIERQVAAGLETLELAQEEEHQAQSAMDSSHKSCVWVTELHEDLENADATTLMEAAHTGVLTMTINVAPQPLAEEDAAAVGYAFHDLRAERAGGYVFAPEDTDLSEPLGIMGITVTVDAVDVTWGGGTYFDGQGDQIAEQFNKDWGVEAAVTVHALISD